jgi:hypothetical protein
VLPDKNEVPIGSPRSLIEFAALFVPPSDGSVVIVYPPLELAGDRPRSGTTPLLPVPPDAHPLRSVKAKIEAINRSLT